MTTEIIQFNSDSVKRDVLNSIFEGIPIAFPTETVYGLGTPISNIQGAKEIFRIKGRELTKPLAAHISNLKQVDGLSKEIPDDFFILAEKFLPGPLAIIIKKSDYVDDIITCGFDTISIRFPSDDTALNLIDIIGEPLAATSANLSGNTSSTNPMEVYNELNGKIKFIIDGGTTKFKQESTILSLTNDLPVILRQGIITKNEIEDVLHKIIGSL